MSRVVIGYLDGHTLYRDDGPGTARISNRGGLALGQALTASNIKPVASLDFGRPVADVTPPLRKVPGLRGESVLNRRRK